LVETIVFQSTPPLSPVYTDLAPREEGGREGGVREVGVGSATTFTEREREEEEIQEIMMMRTEEEGGREGGMMEEAREG